MDFPNEWGVSIADPERRIKELESEVERLKAERGEFSDVMHRAMLACHGIEVELIRRNKAREKQLREKSRRLTEAQERIEAALEKLIAPLQNDYITRGELRSAMRAAVKALTGGRE